MLIKIAAAILAVSMAGGSFVGAKTLSGKKQPLAVALIHGIIGLIGMGLITTHFIQTGLQGLALYGFLGFIIVYLGGGYLFCIRNSEEGMPHSAIIIHGSLAWISFIVFNVGVFFER